MGRMRFSRIHPASLISAMLFGKKRSFFGCVRALRRWCIRHPFYVLLRLETFFDNPQLEVHISGDCDECGLHGETWHPRFGCKTTSWEREGLVFNFIYFRCGCRVIKMEIGLRDDQLDCYTYGGSTH